MATNPEAISTWLEQNPTRRFRRRLVLCLAPVALAAGLLAQENARPQLARVLLDRVGTRRGVCAVLGADGDLAVAIARASELLVHVRDPRPKAVDRLRQRAEAAGFDLRRVVAERGAIDRLPHADNMVDVVLMTSANEEALRDLSAQEVLRALRPRGTAVVGNAHGKLTDERALAAWAAQGAAEGVSTWQDGTGTWVRFRKKPLAGVDAWTHWEHAPDNNPVSSDSVIQAPYLTQFLATPFYIGMPSVTTAAGGRTFLAIGHIAHHRREWATLNKLIARNGYNAAVLWERKLPEDYLVHRSAFIATEHAFHMIDGARALLLDPETGAEKGEIRIPRVDSEWKWMALSGDVLYVLAGKPEPGVQVTKGDRSFGGWSWQDLSPGYYGKRIPFGFGDTLVAYDTKKKRVLWRYEEENGLIDSRGMAIQGGKIFLYCPELHLRCLDLRSGRILWTNNEERIANLIERPGRGLISTPGWRTQCITVATPEALILQGQTRMNVVAVSTADGRFLWTKKKISNNPNVLYVDGRVVLGIGPRASHLVLDPVSGEVQDDLGFRKAACTRLTASPDSFFCRGEGTLRYDRATGRVWIDGSVRPACNDGVIPANGLLYLGPWQCDCNLSLIGHMGRCSAGDFDFEPHAIESERLQVAARGGREVAALTLVAGDWPTYRGNNARSAGSKVELPRRRIVRQWEHRPPHPYTPSAPTAAGGLVFVAGDDGKVRALDGSTGALRWEYATPGPIKSPPTIDAGRAYFGSGDGHVYALEAASGELLWRFRAAPVERYIMVYGFLSSTWPVHTGVLVHAGVAYFAAGIIDSDGTHVFALDAETGKLRWYNGTSGHLSKELRKGVSAQGNLTIHGDELLLAGGNQISPARFDLATGACLHRGILRQGQPKANHGRFVGVFGGSTVIAGGRILHSSPRNVASKGHYAVVAGRGRTPLNWGGIPPAWDDATLALVNTRFGKLTCCATKQAKEAMQQGIRVARGDRQGRFRSLAEVFQATGAVRWQTDLSTSNTLEVVSLAVCPKTIVAVVRLQHRFRSRPQWFLVGFDTDEPTVRFRQELRREPLPGGILIDRAGHVVLTMLDGSLVCFGARS